jgi:hypothetical protein
MKSRPVRKYAQPKYPTRLEIAARPALLHRHQPPAWRKWPELTGAAGLFLLADATRLLAADNPPKLGQTPTEATATAIIAPIFQHGEGRGATGCIVMSPPVFLSEEEALQVIREEMASKGVKLGTNQTTLAGTTVERVVSSVPVASTGATKGTKPAVRSVESKQEPPKADAGDPKKKVFIEFVGASDARHWDWERSREAGKWIISSVQSYDLPKTANYVVERVKQQTTDKLYSGVFYDPMAGILDFSKLQAKKPSPGKLDFEAAMADAKVESRRLLRLQVQDFLKWLQAQGAI